MQLKHFFYSLCAVFFCMTASAGEEFMLAYYVEVHKDGGKFVLQQYGRPLSVEHGIYTPIGRGGRGKFSLSLASLGEKNGVLRMEIYDDKPGTHVVKTPAYSLDIDFSKEGAKGDVIDTNEEYKIDLSYSIVPK